MFKDKQKDCLSARQGFTLIGVMATLFIVAIGLTGVISLANMSLKSATTSKMRLIAASLAQEGVEIIRDMRRSNIEWDDWYGSISNGNYRVQYTDDPPVLVSVFNDDDTRLKIDVDGYYQYNSGNDSPFYRKVIFNNIPPNEVKLVVEVKWYIRGRWSSLTVEDHLWNWK